MKLTKANLQKIIQEEIENLMSEEEEEEFTDLKAHVEELAKAQEDVHITDPRATVGTTLPDWLIRGKPTELEKLQNDPKYSKNLTDEKGEPLKGVALKKALGLKCLDPRTEQPKPC